MSKLKRSVLPGNKSKKCHQDLIKDLPIVSPNIVEGFLGSGQLAQVIIDCHGSKSLIGAEKFEPLKAYHESNIDLSKVQNDLKSFVLIDGDIDKLALDKVWRYCQDIISKRSPKEILFPLTEPQALAILLEGGYCHSIRFSKKGHNISVDISKIRVAIKNGLRSPVVLKSEKVFDDWSEALEAGDGPNSIFTSDPPYLNASQIYCHDNPPQCSTPPIKRAMELNYHEILAFNNFDWFLNQEVSALAKTFGYKLTSGPTKYKYQINNKRNPKNGIQNPPANIQKMMECFSGTEEIPEEIPKGEWWWFLSKDNPTAEV